jgi:hypothetical protein
MAILVAFTVFTMILAGTGLFMNGLAAMRQARLSKRMFDTRYRSLTKAAGAPVSSDDRDSESH